MANAVSRIAAVSIRLRAAAAGRWCVVPGGVFGGVQCVRTASGSLICEQRRTVFLGEKL